MCCEITVTEFLERLGWLPLLVVGICAQIATGMVLFIVVRGRGSRATFRASAALGATFVIVIALGQIGAAASTLKQLHVILAPAEPAENFEEAKRVAASQLRGLRNEELNTLLLSLEFSVAPLAAAAYLLGLALARGFRKPSPPSS